jgi:hypothetical protein
MMKKRVLAAVAALGLTLSGPSYANLVFNGGFELGNVIGDRTNYIYGWMTRGDVYTDNSMVEIRHSGSYAAQFSQPEAGPGRVAQTLQPWPAIPTSSPTGCKATGAIVAYPLRPSPLGHFA